MTLLCVIAATHYIVIPEIRKDICGEVKESTEGVAMLFKMMQKIHNGTPLFVIPPELLFSTDDTVQYIFERKGIKKDRFRLASAMSQKIRY